MSQETDTLTVAQAARLLQVSQETIRRHLKTGIIPGWKVGRQWRISRRVILSKLEGHEAK